MLYETCRTNEQLIFTKGPDKDDDEADDNYSKNLISVETRLLNVKL